MHIYQNPTDKGDPPGTFEQAFLDVGGRDGSQQQGSGDRE